MSEHFVIVGSGAAGVAASLALREHGFDGKVTLLGEEPCPPYERPAVSKGLLTGAAIDPIVPPETFATRGIEILTGQHVASIDMINGLVNCENGQEIAARKVLLATGGNARRLSVPGSELGGVFYVRTARDSAAIAPQLRPNARIVVVGGGLIGAEVCATAVSAGCNVTWLEATDRCLQRALPPPFDTLITQVHLQRGVNLRTNAAVNSFIGSNNVQAVSLSDGSTVPCDFVVLGIGIEPNVELAQSAGAEIGDGVIVNDRCETSVPNLFAAGDVACHPSRWTAQPRRIEHWRHAQDHGAAAARSMLGLPVSYDELPWFWTDQYNYHFECCGIYQANDVVVMREAGEGAQSAFYLREGRLVAAATLGRINDVRAAMRFIPAGITPDTSDLADPDVDLRKLGRSLINAAT